MRLELFGGTYFKAICLINKATGIWFTHSPLPGSLPQSLLVRYGTLSILQNLGDCFNKAQFITQTTRGHSSNINFSNCSSNFQVSLILVFSTDKDDEICFPLRQQYQETYRRHSLNSFPVSLSDIESRRYHTVFPVSSGWISQCRNNLWFSAFSELAESPDLPMDVWLLLLIM